MYRRRHCSREIPFSFDSFLDVVANVVGIIIRLILVAWVGARSYSSLSRIALRPGSHIAPLQRAEAHSPLKDPLQDELAEHQMQLAKAQARLLEQLRQWHLIQDKEAKAKEQMAEIVTRQKGFDQEAIGLEQQKRKRQQAYRTSMLSLEQLRQREEQVMKDIDALEKMPPPRRLLRYHTPISQPVHADEFFFECRHGRVTFIDIASLMVEIRAAAEEKGQELRRCWKVSDVTAPVGAFRLHYTFERDHGLIDSLVAGAPPEASGDFHYRLSEWVVEPIAPLRGESLRAALAQGSEFRQVADRLDPQQAVVTFWVYPDSFSLFRELRDYLYDRGLVIAGRPLPEDVPIASSRNGSISRGE